METIINQKINIFSNNAKSQKVAYRQWQGTQSLPILALHGWLDNLESFSPLMSSNELQRDDWSVTAMDFAGHGESFTRGEGENLHFIDNVADIIAFTEAMGWDKFIILGHSMGAGLGSLVAATYPERVQGFISIEALGPLASEASDAVVQLKKHLKSRLRKPRELPVYKSKQQALDARMSKGGADEASMRVMVERNLKEVSNGFSWKTDQRLRAPTAIRMTEAHAQQILKEIECPSLVIWGEQGFKSLYPELYKRGKALENFKQIELTGGHHLHMENALQVAEQVKDFLKQFRAYTHPT